MMVLIKKVHNMEEHCKQRDINSKNQIRDSRNKGEKKNRLRTWIDTFQRRYTNGQ